jgi:hypothetical protein
MRNKHLPNLSKTERVLSYIADAGEGGRSFSEIQRFIVETLHGLDYDQREVRPSHWTKGTCPHYGSRRLYRGFWCNYLLRSHGASGRSDREGLLATHCLKSGKNYVLKRSSLNLLPVF